MLVLVVGLVAGALAGGPGAAVAESFKDVIVRNGADNPVPTQAIGTTPVQGTVDVGNLPATQNIAGSVGIDEGANTVEVGNLPATQNIAGSVGIDEDANTVNVGNFPVSQQVAGIVGIDPAANTVQAQVAQSYVTRTQAEGQWNFYKAGYGRDFAIATELDIPDGQQLQARWISMEATLPTEACTVQWARVSQWAHDGRAGSFSPATKVGPRQWVASDEVLVPNVSLAVVSAHCPEDATVDWPNAKVSVDATVAGDLFPAP